MWLGMGAFAKEFPIAAIALPDHELPLSGANAKGPGPAAGENYGTLGMGKFLPKQGGQDIVTVRSGAGGQFLTDNGCKCRHHVNLGDQFLRS